MLNKIKSQFTHQDLQIVDKKTVFQGYFRMDRYHLKHRLFAGGWSETLPRELFERGRVGAALLFDPLREEVVLTEQFRLGALGNEESPWLIEIVAGVMDETDDSVEEVVYRETKEESGCDVIQLLPICDYWVSPGGTSERVALFCAKVDASQADKICGLKDEHEDIRVFSVSATEAFAAVSQGQINNAPSIIALQWLELNYEKVKKIFE